MRKYSAWVSVLMAIYSDVERDCGLIHLTPHARPNGAVVIRRRVLPGFAALLLCLTMLATGVASAQTESTSRAALTGTLTYHHLVFPSPSNSSAHPWARRFAGRIGLPVAATSYVGFAVGS